MVIFHCYVNVIQDISRKSLENENSEGEEMEIQT